MKTANPITKRKINVYGSTFNKLLQNFDYDSETNILIKKEIKEEKEIKEVYIENMDEEKDIVEKILFDFTHQIASFIPDFYELKYFDDTKITHAYQEEYKEDILNYDLEYLEIKSLPDNFTDSMKNKLFNYIERSKSLKTLKVNSIFGESVIPDISNLDVFDCDVLDDEIEPTHFKKLTLGYFTHPLKITADVLELASVEDDEDFKLISMLKHNSVGQLNVGTVYYSYLPRLFEISRGKVVIESFILQDDEEGIGITIKDFIKKLI